MARISWSVQASLQLAAIVDYLEEFDPAAARRLGVRLLELADSLKDFPDRGRPIAQGRREMVTVRPYILRYVHEGDTVVILGIRHAAQLAED
ncbi:type II toxin-antitoxin system RelE/ParE family toxin [Sphingomonas pseudosanguinis]|uniref:Plasmid stabilization system protein ParE n=1 Tax=Sphingomonas pseudosanguinis TaxID=413712 RepID=A0A7W6F4V5_9SPHN|nr:type II toxin-antitoxin system RelE/ParE family toxin [Sphingomonas pseudosanguinis]MBB3880860.1 plasmid stabilization system protein ParE [Sphingomonas pseudosanguinis]MBN3535923.1 type II toxin-antitoxin system RelE/ParE family toxin [Sphingomonas pseudosanguinis]